MRRLPLVLAVLTLAALAGCEDEQDPQQNLDLQNHLVAAGLERARADGWDPRYDDLYPLDAASEGFTVAVVYGASLGTPLLFALLLLLGSLRAFSQKRAADRDAADAQAAEALTVGPAMLHGEVVEVAEPGPAVRLVIRQTGQERKGKNSRKTIWTEDDRKIAVQPFVIALANGQRVRVEPIAEATLLADDLSAGELVAHGQREREAELTIGETVYASGMLERAVDPTAGFRGETSARVLRPPASGPMRLSTRPLGETYAWRVRRGLIWAALALGVAAAGALWLHRPYLLARHGGFSTGTAVVAAKTIEENDDATFYLVTVVVAETEAVFREALDRPVFDAVQIGDRMPVQYHPDHPDYGQIGQRAAMYSGKTIFAVMLLVGLFSLALVFWRSGMPWYAAGQVVDTEAGSMPKFEE